jgi:hypothetical protein
MRGVFYWPPRHQLRNCHSDQQYHPQCAFSYGVRSKSVTAPTATFQIRSEKNSQDEEFTPMRREAFRKDKSAAAIADTKAVVMLQRHDNFFMCRVHSNLVADSKTCDAIGVSAHSR